MVHVADVTASDGDGSGVASLTVAATGGDVRVDGGSIALRAERRRHGRARVYRLAAQAVDVAGNVANATAKCIVPRSWLSRHERHTRASPRRAK
jgi:hypothetical protein